MAYYQYTKEDLSHLSPSAEAAALKHSAIQAGATTKLLRQVSDMPGSPYTPHAGAIGQRFLVHAWYPWRYAGNERMDLSDEAQQQEFLDRFNTALACVWNTDDFNINPVLLAFLKRHGIPLIVQVTSEAPGNASPIPAIEEAGGIEVLMDTRVGISRFMNQSRILRLPNLQSGDMIELEAYRLLQEIGKLVGCNQGVISDIVFDAELEAGISPGEIAKEVAALEGMEPVNWDNEPDGPYTVVVSSESKEEKSRQWAYQNSNRALLYQTIRRRIKENWPGLGTTGGMQLTPYELAGTDAWMDWTSVSLAPDLPESVAFHTAMMDASRRLVGKPKQDMVVGPQSAKFFKDEHGKKFFRATPHHQYSAACWHAVANGVHGVTGWPLPLNDEGPERFMPNGEALWATLKRLKQEVFDPGSDLFMRWKASTGRLAVLCCQTNDARQSCRGKLRGPGFWGRNWYYQFALRNTVWACMLTGEPTSIVFESEVIAGCLQEMGIKVLVVPDAWAVSTQLIEALGQFAAEGGIVLVHDGSPLRDYCSDGIYMLEGIDLAPKYNKGAGIDVNEFRQFLVELSVTIESYCPFRRHPAWQVSDRINVYRYELETDCDRYTVLVSNAFEPDENGEAGWWERWKGFPNRAADLGKELRVIWMGGTVQDYFTGLMIRNRDTIVIEEGWGKVLRRIKKEDNYVSA